MAENIGVRSSSLRENLSWKNMETAGILIGGYQDYRRKIKEGHSRGTALFQAALETVFYNQFPVAMWGQLGYTVLSAGAPALQQWKQKRDRWWNSLARPNVGGGFMDTAQAQTMRQRSVQQIQKSHLNARSALGNEGRLMHFSY